jgi:SIR2-like domain
MAKQEKQEKIVEHLAALHRAYSSKSLRILVGAGASIRAGLPSWSELELNLLQGYLEKELNAYDKKFSAMLLPRVPNVSQSLHAELGQAAADLVWNNVKPDDGLFEMFAKALYGDRSISSLPIPSLQRQVASMNLAKIFTTNYDPILELAMSRVRKSQLPEYAPEAWRSFVGPLKKSRQTYDTHHVYHLHGLLEPDGNVTGTCIFTEGQYHALSTPKNQKVSANRLLLNALDEDGTLLIVGMSLTDRNLKRILYEGKGELAPRRVFAVLREEDQVVQVYKQLLWNDLGVQFIWVRNFGEIESLLRQVKFGPYPEHQPPIWVKSSIQHLTAQGVTPNAIFSNEWQQKAQKVLNELKDQLAAIFPPAHGEEVNLNFLLPLDFGSEPHKLHLVARTGRLTPTGASARSNAELHSFALNYLHEEGSSGAAFVSGRPDITSDDPDLTHRNIPETTIAAWRKAPGFSFWRSIISIPISDSIDWIPMGILAITSNLGLPFWQRFGDRNDDYMNELKQVIRGAVKEFLLDNKPQSSSTP